MNSVLAADLGIDVVDVGSKLRDNRGLPVDTYSDRAVYEFELDAIFARSWQYFAPLAKLSNTGDVVVGQVGRIPIAVTRGATGELHGFVNICRHRGCTVVREDRAGCRRLVCGYHGWCYDLRGELVRAPETDADFDKTALSLLPISVDTFGPAVFVNPDPEAKRLTETHENLLPLTAEHEFEMNPARYSS